MTCGRCRKRWAIWLAYDETLTEKELEDSGGLASSLTTRQDRPTDHRGGVELGA